MKNNLYNTFVGLSFFTVVLLDRVDYEVPFLVFVIFL